MPNSREIRDRFDTVTSTDEAVAFLEPIMNNYRSNPLLDHFDIQDTEVRNIFISALQNSTRSILTKTKLKITQQANGRSHNFMREMTDYRLAFSADSEEGTLLREIFPNDTYSSEQYREAIKSNPKLRNALAKARASQTVMLMLDVLINDSYSFRTISTLETAQARAQQLQSSLDSLNSQLGSNLGQQSGQQPSGTPAPNPQQGQQSGQQSGQPQPSPNPAQPAQYKEVHLVDLSAVARLSVTMSHFLSSVDGSEEFSSANAQTIQSETPVTIDGKHQALHRLSSLASHPQGFQNFSELSAFFQTQLNPPRSLSSNMSQFLGSMRGMWTEGLNTDRQIPEAQINKFFLGLSALKPKLVLDNQEYSKYTLAAIHLLKSNHSANSLTYFMYRTGLRYQDLQRAVQQLSGTITLTQQEQSVLDSLNSPRIQGLRQQETMFLSRFLEQTRMENFQSHAGNLLKDPQKLALIYGTFGAGISALDAFLQMATEMLAGKEGFMSDPSKFWKSFIRFYLFKKLFRKAFSLLGGVPPVTAQEQSFMEKAMDNLSNISGQRDFKEVIREDSDLAIESIFHFYQSHENQVTVNENGQSKDFIKTDNFINFAKSLFVNPDSGTQQTGAVVSKTFIMRRITEFSETLPQAQRGDFVSKAKEIYTNSVRETGNDKFACIQFTILSLSLNSASITSSNLDSRVLRRDLPLHSPTTSRTQGSSAPTPPQRQNPTTP